MPRGYPRYRFPERQVRCPRCCCRTRHETDEHRGNPCLRCLHCHTRHRSGKILWLGGRNRKTSRTPFSRSMPQCKDWLHKHIQSLQADLHEQEEAIINGTQRRARGRPIKKLRCLPTCRDAA